ncbi:diguanylate cyclase [Undibacterium cyanobacteriorum]|uniref:diguanylate cyclase n=1 Tax=Undibacterium cyanobacteriorum TaxID=3073561 RepID=A0ABY9RKX8_9BURK|nr:diguanylate cyclase [Undibacterium sp. 20NA77.5]WMW81354.1 diguanylate cyclase [Undibacterium sp. 20NA77.5]
MKMIPSFPVVQLGKFCDKLAQSICFMACILCLMVTQPTWAGHSTELIGKASVSTHRFELGTPLMRVFLPQEYRAQGQNWAVLQDQRGLIYVGNNDGVLEFDGERWRLIKVSNQTTVRSLSMDKNGRIYVGAVGEIGYLKADQNGSMQYVSLMPKLSQEQSQFSDVWRTYATDDGVIFASFRRILRVKENEVVQWLPSQTFQWPYIVNDRVFVRDAGRGLLELKGKQFELVPGGERFANERIYVMQDFNEPAALSAGKRNSNERILIGTQQQGFFILEDGQFRAWKTDIDLELKSSLLYCSAMMPDGTFYFGTVQSGLFHLDRNGKLLAHIDRANGLPDQAVYGLRLDRDNGLWLTLDRGIVRIEVTDPFSRFHENTGLVGSSLQVHRHRGELFSATTQGVYKLRPGADAHFERVEGINGPTWGLASIQESLIIANYQGVYLLKDKQLEKIPYTETALCFLFPKEYPNQIWVGIRSGILRLQFVNGKWTVGGTLPNIKDEVRTMVQDQAGDIWVGSNSTGVVRLRIKQTEDGEHIETARYGANDGLPSQNKNWAYLIDKEVRFGTNGGIYLFNASSNRFEPDPRFKSIFATPSPVYSIYQDQRNQLWFFSQNTETGFEELRALQVKDGKYEPIHTKALGSLNGERAEGMQRIFDDEDGVMWFGGTKGLFRFDQSVKKEYDARFKTMIRAINGPDSVIFGGSGDHPKTVLEYSQNRLRFDYTANSYDGQQGNLYQVFLEGNDSGWSNWNSENYQDYSNLAEGEYRFRVRAKNIYGVVSDEAAYPFTVKAPWYRSYFAYLLYFLFGLFVIRMFSEWRVARINAQKQLLEELVLARTKQLEHAYAEIEKISLLDPLTGLGNRRHLTQALSNLTKPSPNEDRRAARGNRYAFILIDVDHFKTINDTHGHASGDAILTGIAGILREHCRADDLAIRWGGEEFLLCARVNDEHEALAFASRLRQAVGAASFEVSEQKQLKATVSIGVACYPFFAQQELALTHEQVILVADACLYTAKRNGRDQCVCATGSGSGSEAMLQRLNTDITSFLQLEQVHLQSDKMNDLQ